MADTVISSADSIIAWFNNDVPVDVGNVFKVQKRTGAIQVFRVDEDGHVVLAGDVLRDQAISFENSLTGSGSIVSFRKDGIERVKIMFQAATNTTTLSAGSELRVRSAKDIVLQLDHDADGTANFLIGPSSADPFFTVAESGDCTLKYGSVTCFELGGGQFTVGDGAEARGRLLLQNDQTLGADRAPLLILEDKTGQPWYFWLDSTLDLRARNSDPGASDLTGAVVGA
jgi:hypothetical protein